MKFNQSRFTRLYPDAMLRFAVGPTIVGNLDHIPVRILRRLGTLGISSVSIFDWSICDKCNRAFRTDSSDALFGQVEESGVRCIDCIDVSTYYRNHENTASVIPFRVTERHPPRSLGYVLVIRDIRPTPEFPLRMILDAHLYRRPSGRFIFVDHLDGISLYRKGVTK